jgi:hypothetical protein
MFGGENINIELDEDDRSIFDFMESSWGYRREIIENDRSGFSPEKTIVNIDESNVVISAPFPQFLFDEITRRRFYFSNEHV